MRVLVTGAAGFIGSHIVEALTAAGHDVRALDLRPPDHRAEAGGDAAAAWIVGDVRNADTVARCLVGVDAVCHQAAKVGLGVDISDMPDYADINVTGTATLLAGMARAGVRRLVLASSMVIYGEGTYTCATHGDLRPGPRSVTDLEAGRFEASCPLCGASLRPGAVSEAVAADPRNPYADTKLAQEHLAASWARATGSSVIALRYHNVYGPRMPRNTPYAGVASIFRSALARGEAPQVFEDGHQRRDFVHVRDVAQANLLALEALNALAPQPPSNPPQPTEPAPPADPSGGAQPAAADRAGGAQHTVATDRAGGVQLAAAAADCAGADKAAGAREGLDAWESQAALRGGMVAYNVASGEPHTVGEMAAALAEALDGPRPEVTGAFRLGDVRHIVASPEKARAELGFKAQISFAEGMAEFAAEQPDPTTRLIDVILPCLNEAKALPWVLGRMPDGYRAIVVDNGSTDGSADLAADLGAIVVTEPRRGFGAACHAGLLAATADTVCFMDADASLDPRDLPALVAKIQAGTADLVLGRRRPTTRDAWPTHARIANIVLASALNRRLGGSRKLHDLGPMRATRREALLALGIADRRFGYPLEMVLRAGRSDWRITEIDVPYRPRSGRSKVTGTLRGTLRAIRDMRKVLAG